ncbi:hypothetical protein GCM10010172_04660 [Paractinoplanes ferrugineus]|uniref:Uncharacterized protein n=1 Tax=Paractinoplanes ferrugineus TaxID=113564 RepID=A0A919MLW1_9ACTN|nr:hypothetical protein [Actinoplanes ferrugineus]GIE12617.1 hypothetical protein Afe05nite_44570 [Actinoplanes ferrugineus]
MSIRIDSTADKSRWVSHIAQIHLTTDFRRLAADLEAGSDRRVIAADKAAVVESRMQYASARGSNRYDVTV